MITRIVACFALPQSFPSIFAYCGRVSKSLSLYCAGLTKFTGFSLKWYKKLLTDNDIIAAVYVSISIAVIATIISTVLGNYSNRTFKRNRKILREWLLNVNNMPIMNPDIVTCGLP